MGYIVPIISSVIIQYSFPFLDGVDFFEPVIRIVRNCKRVYSLYKRKKKKMGKILVWARTFKRKIVIGVCRKVKIPVLVL